MNSPTHAQDKQNLIFLVGMMGTGKSTIGKELAEQRKVKFIDSDSEIEKDRGGERIPNLCQGGRNLLS